MVNQVIHNSLAYLKRTRFCKQEHWTTHSNTRQRGMLNSNRTFLKYNLVYIKRTPMCIEHTPNANMLQHNPVFVVGVCQEILSYCSLVVVTQACATLLRREHAVTQTLTLTQATTPFQMITCSHSFSHLP